MSCVAAIVLGIIMALALIWGAVMTILWAQVKLDYDEIINSPQGDNIKDTTDALNNPPKGYAAVKYGYRVAGSAVDNTMENSTLDACVAACDANADCTAVRYNYDTQECRQIANTGISSSDLSVNNLTEASFIQQ